MSAAWPLPVPDRFALLIHGLLRAVAASHVRRPLSDGEALPGPFIVLLWGRISRLGVRFARLAVRVSIGRAVVRRRPERPSPAETLSDSSRPERRQPGASPAQPRLPRGFGWLGRLVPEARAYSSQLQFLLSDPEMARLLAQAPQMERMLRPLCRMLAVMPDPAVLPPPSPSGRRAHRRRADATTPDAASVTDTPTGGSSMGETSIAEERTPSPDTAAADIPFQPRRQPYVPVRDSTRAGLACFFRRRPKQA